MLSRKKTVRTGRRRRLSIYTKAPFKLTNEHYKAILSSVTSFQMVEITYKLTLSGTDVQGLKFGGVEVDLEQDKTDDEDVFENSEPIIAPVADRQLWIVVRAEESQMAVGGQWTLVVKVNEEELPDSPIEEEADINGKADHDEMHIVLS